MVRHGVEQGPALKLPRRLLGVAALVPLAIALAGCGGGGRESPGHFVTRILREEISGQWAAQWRELHPGQQKLITQDEYVLCSERMSTNVATGHEKFTVRNVRDSPIRDRGVPERTAKLVTISVASSAIDATFHFHAVLHGGRWRWVLAPDFAAAVAQGRCLDGSRLGGTSSQSSSAAS